jgi:hypothetical protein
MKIFEKHINNQWFVCVFSTVLMQGVALAQHVK